MECTGRASGACHMRVRLLPSPVLLFLWKAVDFSFVFLSASISTYLVS